MTTKKILGIDVSAHFVVAAIIENRIDDKLEYFRTQRENIVKLLPNKDGIAELLAMGVTHAAMEPTGVHYSRLWAEVLNANGVEILWVGHCQLKAYRKSNRLPNKNDYADALALGCYGFENVDKLGYFVRFNPFSVAGDIRQLSLQLSHLNRVQSPIINRIRQALAFEFPELAEHCGDRSSDLPAPIWRYLAGRIIATQSKNRFNKLLAKSVGTGVSEFTKSHAERMCVIHEQEISIERQLADVIGADIFAPYHKVFDQFGFGQRVRGYLLGTIYPLDAYLDQNRKPIIELVRNKKGQGKSKRYRSLCAFKLALGYGLVEDSSGKSEKWIPGGSNLCRTALWQWEYTKIEPVKNRPQNDIGKSLGDYRDKLKANGIPIKLVRSRVIVRAIEKLFDLLVKEI
jgi:hypothetical protein